VYSTWLWLLEKVYLNAMFIELTSMGFKVEKEKNFSLLFWNRCRDYNADLIVEEVVDVELKAISLLLLITKTS
jgi:GxxExxY protein